MQNITGWSESRAHYIYISNAFWFIEFVFIYSVNNNSRKFSQRLVSLNLEASEQATKRLLLLGEHLCWLLYNKTNSTNELV